LQNHSLKVKKIGTDGPLASPRMNRRWVGLDSSHKFNAGQRSFSCYSIRMGRRGLLWAAVIVSVAIWLAAIWLAFRL
jgi:hypothetical protein